MNTVVTITEPGNNDVLRVESRAVEKPAAGQLLIRQEAIGVNFIDIYHRKGIYPLPAYPAIPGVEGAGVVEAVGDGVEGWSAGDRVVYTGVVGAYAERRLIPAARALHLPDAISAKAAAASLLKAMTVHMLTTQTWPVGPGTTVLVPAAAGGLGSLIVRQAKRLGATVIATVGSPEKEAATRADGADHVIIGRDADIAAEVKRITDGRGVDVAYDGPERADTGNGARQHRAADAIIGDIDAAPVGEALHISGNVGIAPDDDMVCAIGAGCGFLLR